MFKKIMVIASTVFLVGLFLVPGFLSADEKWFLKNNQNDNLEAEAMTQPIEKDSTPQQMKEKNKLSNETDTGEVYETTTEPPTEPPTEPVEPTEPYIVQNGKCGENVEYTMYSDGLLIIDGTGDMSGYYGSNYPSTTWSRFSNATVCIIAEGVTCIGSSTFRECKNLTSITIPESVTSIQYDAFYGCSGLTNITIPKGVTSIGPGAFGGCSSLTDIVLPEGIKSIGENLFSGCSSLENIIIPESVTSIGSRAFSGCSSLTNIIIPESVTSIGSDIFSRCNNLSKIYVVTNSVADKWCKNNNYGKLLVYDYIDFENEYWKYKIGLKDKKVYLTENLDDSEHITIPTTIGGYEVVSIEDNVFSGCWNLKSIVIPECVTNIGDNTFDNCRNLTNIIIPESVTSIGSSAFSGCSSLTNIIIPESVTSIGSSAFSGCSSLTNIIIPESVTSIGSSAFSGCSSLNKIYVISDSYAARWCEENGYSYKLIYDYMYYEEDQWAYKVGLKDKKAYLIEYIGDNEEITIPQTINNFDVIRIEESACSNNERIRSIELLDGDIEVAEKAFSDCVNLERITIPEGIKTIENGLFSGCVKLDNILIPNSVTNLKDNAFSGCTSLSSITIPNGVTSIGSNAFYNCIGLNGIEIPCSAELADSTSFEGVNNIDSIKITKGSGTMMDYNENNYTNTPWYINRKHIRNIELENGINNIGDYSFCGMELLREINIPNSVTKIGQHAFDGCDALVTMTIPDSAEITDQTSFSGVTNLKTINIIKGTGNAQGYLKSELEKLPWYNSRNKITTVNIGEGVVELGTYSLYGLEHVKEIVLPDGIQEIGAYSLAGCSDLEKIVIPESVSFIDPEAFDGDTKLVLYVAEGSYAQDFAKENGFEYQVIEPEPTTEESTTCEPITIEPETGETSSSEYTTSEQVTSESVTSEPITGESTTSGDITVNPTTDAPTEVTTSENTTFPIVSTIDTTTVKPAAKKIIIGKANGVKAKNKKKRKAIITWRKLSNATKYQVKYSTNKKFKKAKIKIVSSTKITLKKLKKKKVYYIRVRGFRGNIFGAWSKTSKVKIKK